MESQTSKFNPLKTKCCLFFSVCCSMNDLWFNYFIEELYFHLGLASPVILQIREHLRFANYRH